MKILNNINKSVALLLQDNSVIVCLCRHKEIIENLCSFCTCSDDKAYSSALVDFGRVARQTKPLSLLLSEVQLWYTMSVFELLGWLQSDSDYHGLLSFVSSVSCVVVIFYISGRDFFFIAFWRYVQYGRQEAIRHPKSSLMHNCSYS